MSIAAALLIASTLLPATASSHAAPDVARIRTKLVQVPQGRITVSGRALNGARLSSARHGGGDPAWDGGLIGAGIGFASGWLWAKSMCPNDGECFAIAAPIGILVGTGVGAAIGALADALRE